jgi:undecaprenyl diphosphate synthase
MDQNKKFPQHIGIIMDGNRRWARRNKRQAFMGHEKVAQERIDELVEFCIKHNIPYLTLWAFSTENWNRPQREVEAIMDLLRRTLKTSLSKLNDQDVRFNTIGELSRFPKDIQQELAHWKEETKNNGKITVTFALNYGGRDEIMRGMKQLFLNLINDHRAKELENKIKSLSEQYFAQYLDTADMPDPDLIIRPGEEKRLSGFMPWQGTYSELYFTDTLMPDFGTKELKTALEDYLQRQRRFGR